MITRFPAAVLAPLLIAAPAWAQTATGAKTALDLLRYDPQTQGALVFIGDDLNFGTGERAQANLRRMFTGKTPVGLGEIVRRRTLRVGTVTALVPREMPVIVADPGKPDPFAGMRDSERLTLFQSLLTPEQWKLFGGASGIGVGNLTDAQRPLFAGLIPSSFTRRTMRPSPTGTGYVPDKESKPQTVPGETVRLRAVRRLTFRFVETKIGKEDTTCASNVADVFPGQKPKAFPDGDEGIETLDSDERPWEKPEGLSAFGVTLIQSVPGRLKPGQLPLDSPVLNARVPLHAGTEPVSALLKRVADATNLRIVADKRYAAQTVTCRLPKAGSTIPARDVLTVLCRSLSATFRRLDAPDGAIFLLTFDVEGIGTQFARLDDWGEVADAARRDAQMKATEQSAKNDPFAAIGYAETGDAPVPAVLLKSLDTFYETGERVYNGMPLKASELPPTLRETFTEKVRYWQKEGYAVRADKLGLAAELGYDFVLPDKTVWASQLDTNISLESFVRREKGTLPLPKPPPSPLSMPPLKKRVV
ncbi:MAG: hypothetical protein H7Y38_06610, partial [Armatimonadetes bacterium]|nr:hypothetical protein [Armatimonadota bacterium]